MAHQKFNLNYLLHVFLAGGALIVLLPLFWMLVTAVKQPGQALKFQFWPATEVAGPLKTVRTPPAQKADLTLEWNPVDYPTVATPSRVAVAGSFNDWNRTRLLNDRGVWSITFHNLAVGTYRYHFIVDGDQEMPDQAHQHRQGNYSLITLHPGHNQNRAQLTDATMLRNGQLLFQVAHHNVRGLRAVVQGQKKVKLHRQGNCWRAKVAVTGAVVKYQLIYSQSWRQGLGQLYTLSNFTKVLHNKDFPFGRFFINSLIVALGCGLITALICTMGGYAFAKKEFFLRDQLFMVLLGTMMIPGMIFMVPQFAIVNKLGWINSYQAMIVPHLANIFGLFLLRQYIMTIPNSLFEAARIDGANELQVFRTIIIPLSYPVIVTLFLLTFVGQWSNFLWQLIVNTPDSAYRTLPVGLALFKGQYGVDWELMMAGACFSIIPIAILFLAAQRFFIEGMTRGAVKG